MASLSSHRGLLRSEGKDYPVRDGDVIRVLFNVAR
jgi:ribosome-binding ATPase YchF (GTP1/OBG family)